MNKINIMFLTCKKMYLNDGLQITNTPLNLRAFYNTLPYYVPPGSSRYTPYPQRYIDANGNLRTWNSFETPKLRILPGGTFNGTSTRTAGWFQPNVVIDN